MAKEKREGKGVPAVLLIGGAIVATVTTLYFATRAKAAGALTLTAGSNELVYTGKRQTAEKAFASIIDYLVIAYYLDSATEQWIQITSDTVLETDMTLNISVTYDCIWIF